MEETRKLIETGMTPEEAGLAAARQEFETLGSESRAAYVTVAELLLTAAMDIAAHDPEGAKPRTSSPRLVS